MVVFGIRKRFWCCLVKTTPALKPLGRGGGAGGGGGREGGELSLTVYTHVLQQAEAGREGMEANGSWSKNTKGRLHFRLLFIKFFDNLDL